jgi:hypothetical protein
VGIKKEAAKLFFTTALALLKNADAPSKPERSEHNSEKREAVRVPQKKSRFSLPLPPGKPRRRLRAALATISSNPRFLSPAS